MIHVILVQKRYTRETLWSEPKESNKMIFLRKKGLLLPVVIITGVDVLDKIVVNAVVTSRGPSVSSFAVARPKRMSSIDLSIAKRKE